MQTQSTTNELQSRAVTLIEAEAVRLNNYSAVANKCEVSEAVISQIRKGTYPAKGEEMYRKIITALQPVNLEGWSIAMNTNTKMLLTVMQDAKDKSLWIPIAEKAGSGKSTAVNIMLENDSERRCFKITCRKWGALTFLTKLCREIGIDPDRKRNSVDDLIELIADYFNVKGTSKPLLIIDQANSLAGGALTSLIYLWNELEGRLGAVIIGTEALEHAIKKGVRAKREGYDELDSRLGRRYIKLPGSTLADVSRICEVNGIMDRELQKRIFNECGPINKAVGEGQLVKVVEDHRPIKKRIQSHLLQITNN